MYFAILWKISESKIETWNKKKEWKGFCRHSILCQFVSHRQSGHMQTCNFSLLSQIQRPIVKAAKVISQSQTDYI